MSSSSPRSTQYLRTYSSLEVRAPLSSRSISPQAYPSPNFKGQVCWNASILSLKHPQTLYSSLASMATTSSISFLMRILDWIQLSTSSPSFRMSQKVQGLTNTPLLYLVLSEIIRRCCCRLSSMNFIRIWIERTAYAAILSQPVTQVHMELQTRCRKQAISVLFSRGMLGSSLVYGLLSIGRVATELPICVFMAVLWPRRSSENILSKFPKETIVFQTQPFTWSRVCRSRMSWEDSLLTLWFHHSTMTLFIFIAFQLQMREISSCSEFIRCWEVIMILGNRSWEGKECIKEKVFGWDHNKKKNGYFYYDDRKLRIYRGISSINIDMSILVLGAVVLSFIFVTRICQIRTRVSVFPHFLTNLSRFCASNKYNFNMFKHVFLILLLLSKIACKFQQVNNILILTDDDFEKARDQYPKLFVFFHNRSTSDYWKNTTLKFEKLALNHSIGVKMAKVDIKQNPELTTKYIKDFPYNTFVYFTEDFLVKTYYTHIAERFEGWLLHAEKPFIVVNTKKEMEEIMRNPKSKVLYFGKSQGKNFEAWRTASFHELQTQFVLIENEKLFGEYTDGTILLAKKYNTGQTDFSDSDVRKWVYLKYSGTKFLSAWLWAHSNSHFKQYGYYNWNKTPALILYRQNSNYSQAKYVLEQFCATVSDSELRLFCVETTTKSIYESMAKYLGVLAEGQFLVIDDIENQKLYLYQSNILKITGDQLVDWVMNFKHGNLVPNIPRDESDL